MGIRAGTAISTPVARKWTRLGSSPSIIDAIGLLPAHATAHSPMTVQCVFPPGQFLQLGLNFGPRHEASHAWR